VDLRVKESELFGILGPNEASLDLIMEPTNVAWFKVAVYIRREGPQVKIYRVKSEKVQDLRKFYQKHTKTDSLDARTLARMPVVDFDSLEEVYVRPKDLSSLAENIYQRAEETCILFDDEDEVIDYDDLQDRIRSEFRIFKALQKG